MTEKTPIYGMYRGRPEKLPGKMIFREKGWFAKLEDAQIAQLRLKKQGKKTKIVKLTEYYSLQVIAPHDFWAKNFIYKRK
jgi:hypothetical protein